MKKGATAVAIACFTASDMMELNVVMIESFWGSHTLHWIHLQNAKSQNVPSQQDSQFTKCSSCPASAVLKEVKQSCSKGKHSSILKNYFSIE